MTHDDETPGQTAWRLILSDDSAEIARIEAAYGRTQAEKRLRVLSRLATGAMRFLNSSAAKAHRANGSTRCGQLTCGSPTKERYEGAHGSSSRFWPVRLSGIER
jgi:hypothetical protein